MIDLADWIYRYYIHPIIYDTSYNPVDTITWAVVLGLGTWLVLEVLGIDEPVEPQLIGLVASAVGMVFGSLSAPVDQRAAIASRS